MVKTNMADMAWNAYLFLTVVVLIVLSGLLFSIVWSSNRMPKAYCYDDFGTWRVDYGAIRMTENEFRRYCDEK